MTSAAAAAAHMDVIVVKLFRTTQHPIEPVVGAYVVCKSYGALRQLDSNCAELVRELLLRPLFPETETDERADLVVDACLPVGDFNRCADYFLQSQGRCISTVSW